MATQSTELVKLEEGMNILPVIILTAILQTFEIRTSNLYLGELEF